MDFYTSSWHLMSVNFIWTARYRFTKMTANLQSHEQTCQRKPCCRITRSLKITDPGDAVNPLQNWAVQSALIHPTKLWNSVPTHAHSPVTLPSSDQRWRDGRKEQVKARSESVIFLNQSNCLLMCFAHNLTIQSVPWWLMLGGREVGGWEGDQNQHYLEKVVLARDDSNSHLQAAMQTYKLFVSPKAEKNSFYSTLKKYINKINQVIWPHVNSEKGM